MPHVSDEAYVLARYPFRERSAVVALLNREGGVVRALARQARGRGGRILALEPLHKLRVSLFVSPRRELAVLDEAIVLRSPLALASRPVAWGAAWVVAELCLAFCPPGLRQEGFFRLLERSLDWLEGGVSPEAVVAYGELWALKLSGVFGGVERCGVCRSSLQGELVWQPEASTFVCAEHGKGGRKLSRLTSDFLRQALERPLDRVQAPAIGELLAFLRQLVEAAVEKELKSLKVFAELRR